MRARVLVIGLDAAEATLLERWSSEGRLRTIAALTERGSTWRLGNPLETLPGAIWPEITTGRSAGRVAQFFHPDQLHTAPLRARREHTERGFALGTGPVGTPAGLELKGQATSRTVEAMS